MKRILLLGFITLSVCCCTKNPAKEPEKEPAKEPNLELQVNEIQETSVRVTTTIDPGSYTIISQGVCYGKNTNPTINDLKVVGVGSVSIVNLDPGTKYYARAYATTAKETFYSSVVEFTTLSLQEVKFELKLQEFNETTAKFTLNVDRGSYVITTQGVCYSKNTTNPTINDLRVVGVGSVSIVDLDPGVKYYAKAYATTAKETFYSMAVEFTTTDIVVTAEVSDIDYRTAKLTMGVSEEFKTISEKGIVYSKINKLPTTADTKLVGSTHNLTLLDYEATYFIRGYVVISGRTVYSGTSEFTTKTLERVSDYDGNQYRVIELASKIGPRKWLLDNFKGTHYANGDPIPHVTDNNEWTCLSSGAYCYYDNDKENAKTYGALYNWWAAVDPRGLIVGWHTPSDLEWNEMSRILPNESTFEDVRGQKLKEAGTQHWQAPNQGANNQTGFTALPGGGRANEDGKFYYLETRAYFQCTTEIAYAFWSRKLYHDRNEFNDSGSNYKEIGASIRLIKNN